jgi:3-phenylpropionate/trans-cinnamate dioxygenase ferredoxin reductase subunit
MTEHDVLIVGSGHGGAQAAISLRQGRLEGSIAIATAETDLTMSGRPYKRTTWRKAGFRRMLIRPELFWSDRSVELLHGRHVTNIDPSEYSVSTPPANGSATVG